MEIASQEKLLLDLTKIFNDLRVDYYITGGMAVSVWGRPRSTHDIDVIIKVSKSQVNLLVKAFKEISENGYADESMAIDAIQNKGNFNFIDGDSGLKVDFWVFNENNEMELLKFNNRKKEIFLNQKMYFISPEDLILSKLDWCRDSHSTLHLGDIESVLRVRGKELDMDYLKKWAEKLDVIETLNELL